MLTITYEGEDYLVMGNNRHKECVENKSIIPYRPHLEDLEGQFWCKKHNEHVEFPNLAVLEQLAAKNFDIIGEQSDFKVCKKCGANKPKDEFGADGKGGKRPICMVCYNERVVLIREMSKSGIVKVCPCCFLPKFIDDFKIPKDGPTRQCTECFQKNGRISRERRKQRDHERYMKYKADLALRRVNKS